MATVHLDGLPPEYRLEEEADILTLYRSDGSKVAEFSSYGAKPEAIRLAAEEGGSGDGSSAVSKDTLRVDFFGGFELRYGGAPLPACHGAKALSILKYLLARGKRPASRDFLMGWLWPEANLRKARWSLNSSVHTLRRFLADHLPPEQTGEIILCEEGSYRLNPDLPVESDVEEFDERYVRGRRLEEDGDIPGAAREYDAAVELYRGDYLKEDLYEDWTMVERERLTNAYLYMLDRLAAYHARNGRHQRTVEFCYWILEKEPCHEESHRRLTAHYTRLGLHEQALRQHQVYARALKNRYGVVSSPDLHSATEMPGC